MSYAKRRAEKERRRQLDREDPERRQVRNLIKRGKAPRLTIAQDAKGKIPQRGTYRKVGKYPGGKEYAKRVAVVRMNSFLRFTFGQIFANKAAGNAKRA